MTYACPRGERQRRSGKACAENGSDTSMSMPQAVPVAEPQDLAAASAPRELTRTEPLAVVNAAAGLPTDRVAGVSTFITAPRPAQGVARCLAAPGLLAHVIVSKFADHLPLYRLEQMFARHGVALARQTLCDWLARSAELLTPLCQLMIRQVLQSRVIQTDDTPVPVQDDSRDHTRPGRVWLYHRDGGPPDLG